MTTAPSSARSALVVAHPGHELRVHGWLERARPTVFVLTDGSGATRASRLDSTRRVLRAAGAAEGCVFGRLSDRQFYEVVRNREFAWFTGLVDELATSFVELGVDCVASDAREGYNPAHDLCRALVDAAVAVAEFLAGRALRSFDFPLVGPPDDCAEEGGVRLELDEAELARKLAAARGYPEMAGEVDAALRRFGADAFRIECLRPAGEAGAGIARAERAFYERYGEDQVRAGLYSAVIRAHDHVDPLVAALQRHARERTTCRA